MQRAVGNALDFGGGVVVCDVGYGGLEADIKCAWIFLSAEAHWPILDGSIGTSEIGWCPSCIFCDTHPSQPWHCQK